MPDGGSCTPVWSGSSLCPGAEVRGVQIQAWTQSTRVLNFYLQSTCFFTNTCRWVQQSLNLICQTVCKEVVEGLICFLPYYNHILLYRLYNMVLSVLCTVTLLVIFHRITGWDVNISFHPACPQLLQASCEKTKCAAGQSEVPPHEMAVPATDTYPVA